MAGEHGARHRGEHAPVLQRRLKRLAAGRPAGQQQGDVGAGHAVQIGRKTFDGRGHQTRGHHAGQVLVARPPADLDRRLHGHRGLGQQPALADASRPGHHHAVAQGESTGDLVQHAVAAHQQGRPAQRCGQHRRGHALVRLRGGSLLLARGFGGQHQPAQFVGGGAGGDAVGRAQRVAAVVPGGDGGRAVAAQVEGLHAQAVGFFHGGVGGQHRFSRRQRRVQRAGVQVLPRGGQLLATAFAIGGVASRLQPVGELRRVVELQRTQQARRGRTAVVGFGGQHHHVSGQAHHAGTLVEQLTGRPFQAHQGLAQVGAGLRLVAPRPQQPGDAPARAGAFQMQPGQQAGLPRRQRQIGAPGAGDARNAEELNRWAWRGRYCRPAFYRNHWASTGSSFPATPKVTPGKPRSKIDCVSPSRRPSPPATG